MRQGERSADIPRNQQELKEANMGTGPDFDAYENRHAARTQLEAEVLPLNKAALLDLLAAAGVHMVVVGFDGSGDEGSIDAVHAVDAAGNIVEMPSIKVDFRSVNLHRHSVDVEQRTVGEIVEIMAYDFLAQTHDGWENGEGASGEFTFAVPDRTITLEHSERYLAYNTCQHEF